jgi:glycosyltransferase involved in cell wall biosynthesis
MTQIRKSAEHLAALGITASLFDPWTRAGRPDFDLVHLFSAGIGTYHLARELRELRVPMVVSPIMFSRHSPSFVRTGLRATRLLQRTGPGIWSDYALSADICSWAACVAPNTIAEADLVAEGLGVDRAKIRQVPNGVERRFEFGDPSLFVREFGVEGFVLNVGHIGPRRKNVLSLIRALATIDHPAVIIGRITDDPYAQACREEAARHRHIRLISSMPNDSPLLASAYAACDTFVLPSQFETPGIAALEAGLAGAKIVITDRGGTKEYFGELATYVDHQSVDSIRAGVIASLNSPKDSRLRDHIRANFLWEHVAARLAEVYREILGADR